MKTKSFAVMFTMLWLISIFSIDAAQAKSNPRVPITLSVQQALSNSDKHCIGQVANLIIMRTSCRKDTCIPVNTRLEGFVEQVKPSSRFLRPGLLSLKIHSASFPDGRELVYEPSLQFNIRHSEVMTLGKFSKKVMFDILPELGLDFALDRTTSLSPLVEDAISLAPDFIMDYLLETKYPTEPNESALKRATFSLLDATYIPFLISIARKDKLLTISPGDTVQIAPSLKTFQALLQSKKNRGNQKHTRFKIDSELTQNEKL